MSAGNQKLKHAKATLPKYVELEVSLNIKSDVIVNVEQTNMQRPTWN